LQVNKKLLDDFINRWGGAQICDSCKYVSPFGPYSKMQRCCGKEMRLVKEAAKSCKLTS